MFCIFKRKGKAYTEIVPDCVDGNIEVIIRGRVDPDRVIYSDGWRGYNGLVDLGYKKHYSVNHGADQSVDHKCHINDDESFWAFAKGRLIKLQGIADSTFYFNLKECEFRVNNRNNDLYKMLYRMFREMRLR